MAFDETIGKQLKMVNTDTPLIWSVSKEDSQHLTIGTLLSLRQQMIRWTMLWQGGHFLLWAKMGQLVAHKYPTLV